MSFEPNHEKLQKEESNKKSINEKPNPIIRLIEAEFQQSKIEDDLFPLNGYYCLSQNGKKANGSEKVNQDS